MISELRPITSKRRVKRTIDKKAHSQDLAISIILNENNILKKIIAFELRKKQLLVQAISSFSDNNIEFLLLKLIMIMMIN